MAKQASHLHDLLVIRAIPNARILRLKGPAHCCCAHRQSDGEQDQRPEAWNKDVLIAKLCEVELGDPFGVGEEVDLDDLAVADREGGDREGLPVEEGDDSGGAVDERALHG